MLHIERFYDIALQIKQVSELIEFSLCVILNEVLAFHINNLSIFSYIILSV